MAVSLHQAAVALAVAQVVQAVAVQVVQGQVVQVILQVPQDAHLTMMTATGCPANTSN